MTAFEDLTLLRAFVQIVESNSISAAARALQVPQPTLSRHLRTLEERGGAALLRRDTHRMSLTEAGRRMLADARALLALAEDAGQRLRADQQELRGHLRIFATIDFGQFVVTRLLADFLRQHPGITAELGYSNRPLPMIEGGHDVGIVAGSLADDTVVARPVGAVLRYLVTTPALVQSRPLVREPADLADWPWLALSGAQFGGSTSIALSAPRRAAQMLPLAPVFVTEGVTSLLEAVRAGLGVAVLPDWLVRDDLTTGRLKRVLPGWTAPGIPIHVIYPNQRQLPARTRALVEFAVAEVKRQIAQ